MIGFFSPPPPALQAAPPPFLASIPYDVDFSDAADAIGWEYAGEAVNGTISVSGGSLIYTRGSADGARPRIAVGISVVKGAQYTVTLPAPTGTAERKELWVSADGGSFADALTPVAVNEALVATFTAPVDGFGVVWIVMRAGTDSATGETVAISSATVHEAAADPMSLAVLEGSFDDDTSGSAMETASFTPPASALCVSIGFWRRDAERDIPEPSSSHDMAGAWEDWGSSVHVPASGSRLGLQAWARRWSATPGAGTVSMPTSGSVYQRAMAVLSIVTPAATPLIRSGFADNDSTTEITIPFSNTDAPPSGMQGIVATLGEGESTSMALAGYTLLYTVDLGGPTRMRVWAKLGSVANSVTVTGFSAASRKVGGNWGIADA